MSSVTLHSVQDIEIDSLANSGDGVGRLDGRVVFVPGTAPGDRTRVRITAAKKNFLKGRLEELLEPGPDRVPPSCEYFGTCGGCDWQHLAYATQLDAKAGQLRETLERIGGLDSPPVDPIIGCETPYHYRNRIQGTLRDGRLHLHKRMSGEPVVVTHCEIADGRINDFIAAGLPADRRGRVELAVLDGKVRMQNLDDDRSSELGFRQVNDAMARRLDDLMLGGVAGSDAKQILDLYCGRGEWTCRIAAACSERAVLGIDVHPGNIRAARQRQTALGLSNLEFRQGKVEKYIAGLALGDSLCIVDPPRAGLDPRVLAQLERHPPAAMIYVSCHPATLARDLKGLVGGGYEIERIQPLDMFPQTAHLECWVMLRPPGGRQGISAASAND